MADGESSSVRWFAGILISLLAAGGGIVTLLNYFSAPRIERFDASPPQVQADGSATLAWRVSQASSAEITPEIGPVALEGNQAVRLSATTTYELVAQNRWGRATAQQKVVVTPRPITPGPPKPPSGEGIVVLHNNTQTTITHVYFGTAQWGGWSGEQLSDPIPAGGTHTWKLQPGAGIYDLKAEDSGHQVLDQQMGVRVRGTYDWLVGGKP